MFNYLMTFFYNIFIKRPTEAIIIFSIIGMIVVFKFDTILPLFRRFLSLNPTISNPIMEVSGIKNKSMGETKTKMIVENLFGKSFITVRPEFLFNPVTGRNLEIDLYNDELKLGFEYNGEQHYKFCKRFHKNHEEFMNQKYRDCIKIMLCKINNIHLISIPYNEHDIKTFILDKCVENNVISLEDSLKKR